MQTCRKKADALNSAAAQLLAMGHTPLIGINAALPVVEQLPSEDKYEAIMKISMVAADACEAILLIAQGAIVRSVLSCILYFRSRVSAYNK